MFPDSFCYLDSLYRAFHTAFNSRPSVPVHTIGHQVFLSFKIKICLNMFPDFFRYLDSLYRAFHTAVNSAISSRPHDWAHLPSHFTATKYSPSDVTNQTYPSRANTYHLMWPCTSKHILPNQILIPLSIQIYLSSREYVKAIFTCRSQRPLQKECETSSIFGGGTLSTLSVLIYECDKKLILMEKVWIATISLPVILPSLSMIKSESLCKSVLPNWKSVDCHN